jgi:hypothetical protein
MSVSFTNKSLTMSMSFTDKSLTMSMAIIKLLENKLILFAHIGF